MKHKTIFLLIAGFVLGTAISSFINFGLALALLFVFLGGIFGITYFYNRSKIFGAVALLFVSIGLGQLRYQQSDLIGRQSDLQNKIGQRVLLTGVVSDEPEQKENYNRLVLETEDKSKILVYVQNYPKFKYGDKLKITGLLKKPENFGANFDWPAYLAKDGIYYEMFYPQAEFISAGNGFWLKEKLFALKEKFLSAISSSVPEPHSAFLGGITIGARESLPESLQEKFRTTGVAHIVALSGYNITIVAETIMLFFSFLPQYLAIGGGVIGVILFAIMTGASVF